MKLRRMANGGWCNGDMTDEEETSLIMDWQGFYGRQNRTILISGYLEKSMANMVIDQIRTLDEIDVPEDPDEDPLPIRVTIDSPGGELAAAFAIYDWLRSCSSTIITQAHGMCASGALAVFMAGDHRVCMPHTIFMYHEPIATQFVSTSRERYNVDMHYTWVQNRYAEIVKKRAGIKDSVWESKFAGSTNSYFYPQEALELGIVHHITNTEDK